MFCSIIVPTIGRNTLQKTIESLIKQKFDPTQFEIIIVNDSGQPLPQQPSTKTAALTVITTNQRDRSVARNAGAAIAQGDYLCFLDDDDWWLPHTLQAFWQAYEQYPQAGWLYGGTQFIDPEGDLLGQLHLHKAGNCFAEVMSAVWIPLQASLIKATNFFDAGGFDPLINVTEDLDLCRKIALNADFGYTNKTVAMVLRGISWNSSTPPDKVAIISRSGRDELLNRSGVFRRLRNSASTDSFYHGRILHNYLSASLLNLKQGRYLRAASRASWGILSVVLALHHLIRPAYWQAMRIDTLTHTLITNTSTKHQSVSEWLQ